MHCSRPFNRIPCSETTTSQTILKHIAQKCRFCDPAVRTAVQQLQQIQAAREGLASGRPRYGSRKIFFQRIWSRLHGGDSVVAQEDQENNAHEAVAAAAAAAAAATSAAEDEMAALHEEVAAAVAAEAEKISIAVATADPGINNDTKRTSEEAELAPLPANDSKKVKVEDPVDAVEV